jgi:hypothetical protein
MCSSHKQYKVNANREVITVHPSDYSLQLEILTKSTEQSPCEAYKLRVAWRNTPRFMEPESSLPCSQEPATGLYPEKNESSSTYFFHMQCNIILSSTSRCWK